MAEAQYHNTFRVPRSLLADAGIWAGIDFGCSLIKMVYIDKEEALDSKVDPITLHCATYSHAHFEEILKVFKAKVHFPAGQPLQVTGVGCTRLKARFDEVLGVKIVFVQEFFSACRGFYKLLDACGEDVLFYPKATLTTTELQLPVMNTSTNESTTKIKNLKDRYTANNPTDGSPFPALYFQLGSGGGLFFINGEGKSKFCGGLPIAGKAFLGLSKLLIGSSNYEEITKLAEKGDRKNTDLTTSEIVGDDSNSPYAKLPSDVAIMPFAKAVDQNRGLETFSKEDLAAGMVGLISSLVFFSSMSAAEIHGVNRVYFGGGFVRSEVVRKELQSVCDGMFKGLMELRFLRSEHMGAFGTMVSKSEDMMKYMLM